MVSTLWNLASSFGFWVSGTDLLRQVGAWLLTFDELIAINHRVSGLEKSDAERSPCELFDKASADEGRMSWNCLDASNFLAGRFLPVVPGVAKVEDCEDGWGSTFRAGQSTPGTVVRTAKLDVDDKLDLVFAYEPLLNLPSENLCFSLGNG